MRVPLGAIHRGMGQGSGFSNPAACENYLPGMAPGPLPQCDLATGGAPGVSQAEIDTPFCGGFAYGTSGYVACMQNVAANPAAAGVDAQDAASTAANINTILATITNPTTSTTVVNGKTYDAVTGQPITPGTGSGAGSGAGSSAGSDAGSSAGSSAGSGAGSGAGSNSTPAPTGCLQLFGTTEPCWGPIGEYTLLAGLAALIGLYLLMGKR